MKRILLPLLFASVLQVSAQEQSPKRVINKLGNEPVYFIDSVRVSQEDVGKFNANDVAAVSVYKGKTATDLLGDDGKDGAIYIETKRFSKNKYWKYFASKSEAYALAVPHAAEDSTVQYVLNGKLLQRNFDGDLAHISDAVFQSITVISKEELQKQYGVTDKRLGVVVRSSTPADLNKVKMPSKVQKVEWVDEQKSE